MTRWARSGSTQKHKKMPGDATPWSEFANKAVDKSSSAKRKKQKKWKNSKKSDMLQHSDKSVEENVNCKVKFHQDFSEELQSSPKKLSVSVSFHVKDKKKKNRVLNSEKSSSTCSGSKTDESSNSANIRESSISSSMIQDTESIKRPQEQTAGKNNKKFIKKCNQTNDMRKSDDANNEIENPSLNKTSEKKQKILEKIKKKRAEKGIILLPSKVERRLYIIKKRLREKGLPPSALKQIIRRERRKEELKFRKTFNTSKPCFNCRKPGHILADCPEKLGSLKQETGICFKCGSAEHTSFKCPNKVQGFPYATCFICKEQGHISKDCPNNKHGVYPKGGRCNLCGNVNHLKKDCPSLIKNKNEEAAFTLQTINEATSIDAEVTEEKNTKPKKNVKRPKFVKF